MEKVSAILLGGYGWAPGAVDVFHAPLANRFGKADIMALPEFGRLSIRESAECLAERILSKYGTRPLVIAAHSEGGLVAAELAFMLGAQVVRVLAMSTPFHGTSWAYFGRLPFANLIAPSAADMEPGSRYLRGLHSERMQAVAPRLVTVGFCDDIVVGWESSYVAGAACNYLVGGPALHRQALADGYRITPALSEGSLGCDHWLGPLMLNGSLARIIDETWAGAAEQAA